MNDKIVTVVVMTNTDQLSKGLEDWSQRACMTFWSGVWFECQSGQQASLTGMKRVGCLKSVGLPSYEAVRPSWTDHSQPRLPYRTIEAEQLSKRASRPRQLR